MKQCIGVIGAGIMGKGVAQHFAKYGYEVILLDKNPDKVFHQCLGAKRSSWEII